MYRELPRVDTDACPHRQICMVFKADMHALGHKAHATTFLGKDPHGLQPSNRSPVVDHSSQVTGGPHDCSAACLRSMFRACMHQAHNRLHVCSSLQPIPISRKGLGRVTACHPDK